MAQATRSKARCEKMTEDGARPTDCRDETRNKIPFVPPPPMHSPRHAAHAKSDHYFSSFSFRNACLGGIGCGFLQPKTAHVRGRSHGAVSSCGWQRTERLDTRLRIASAWQAARRLKTTLNRYVMLAHPNSRDRRVRLQLSGSIRFSPIGESTARPIVRSLAGNIYV